tara:strand:- start:538 stop:1191 length:654 start_codon:yes stop_codon:yes gene_type:complete
MKGYLLFTIALLINVSCIRAQDNSTGLSFISLESGLNLSKFDFTTSEVKSSFTNGDYSPSHHQAIIFGFEILDQFNFLLSTSYDKYQIIGKSIDINDTHLSYDINYVSTSSGLGYNFVVKDNLKLLLNGSLSFNYLLSGFQNLGSSSYDLEETDFQKKTYGYSIGGGLLYQCTNSIGIVFRYDYKNTLDMNERDLYETYTIISYMYSMGIRFNLEKQ